MAGHAKKADQAKSSVSYESDYYGWIQHNVRAMRARQFKEVDWPNVAEELEDMGKSERRGVRSQLARLLAHLLKWRFQPQERRPSEHSWRASIANARESLRELLEESPSFKSQVQEFFASAYRQALRQAVSETNLPTQTFPSVCPWSLEQAMADDFFPE